MPENNQEESTDPVKSAEKSWLEKQLEGIVGKQENMQPVLRICFSIAGFIAGFVVGNWILGREKDRTIASLQLEIMKFKNESKEQERELRGIMRQLEESNGKQLYHDAEIKVLKERETLENSSRELTGLIPFMHTKHSYLD